MVALSAKAKVTLIATLLFLLSLAIVSFVQLHYVRDEMQLVLADHQHVFVAQIADELDANLRRDRDALAAAAKILPPELINDVERLEKWVSSLPALRLLFSDIVVYSSKGTLILDMPPRGLRGKDVSQQENFQTTMATREPHISKPFMGRIVRNPLVSVSAPVFDLQGDVVAVLVGTLNLQERNFLGSLSDARVGQTGSFALFTRDRLIIMSKDRDRIMTQGPPSGVSPYFDRATSGMEGSEEAVNSRGLQAIFSYSQLKIVPWVLAASLPIEEAYAPIRRAQREIISATLLLALVVAPVIWLAVRLWFDPIQRALKAREIQLKRAQQMAKLAHVVTGPGGKFENWSDTLPALAGLEANRVPDSTRAWLELLPPRDRESFRNTALRAARTGERSEVEYRLQRPTGELVDIRQTMEPQIESEFGDGARWFNTLQDISEQKRAEEDLRRFRLAMDNSGDMIVLIDRSSLRFVDVNASACKLMGYSREELLAMGPLDVLPISRAVLEKSYETMIADPSQPSGMESYYICKDGSHLPFESTRRVIRSGDTWLIVAISRDIRERLAAQDALRESEAHLKRLNRVYAVLSGINTLIVRARDRRMLFEEACRIAAEVGKFPLAWIGVVEPGMRIRVAASSGQGGEYLARMATVLNEQMPQGRGITAQAVREQRPVIANDLENDGQVLIKDVALAHGFRSLIVLPLVVSDKPMGVVALYAEQSGFFDTKEVRLLVELAGDISFAIDHLDKAERLDYLAYHDPLTDLGNRHLFLERLEERLLAAAGSPRKVAASVIDVDRVKVVNDAFGRPAGDLLLRTIAGRLKSHRPDTTHLARIGAEHFAVFADVQDEVEAARLAETKLEACFASPFSVAAQEIRVAPRIGIAMFPADGENAELLLRSAEAALKKAKERSERYVFFEQDMTERTAERLALESKLRKAQEKEQFVLYYQPKVHLETGLIAGVEALIRWQSPELGLVPPGKFIPLLEESGLILDVGAWALRQAARDHRTWVEQNLKPPRVAVNVSSIQLQQRRFVGIVEDAIVDGVAPTGLDLEITESLVMGDIRGNIEKLNAVRGLGVKIAIDDFGTGYSSLAYLAKLPIDTLKVDRSFVITMLKDADTMTMVRSIISMAHELRLKVVAEGVDEEEQAAMLRLLKCDEMQGYLISKPVPAEVLVTLLRSNAAQHST